MWDSVTALWNSINGTAIREQISAENAMSVFNAAWEAAGEHPVKVGVTLAAVGAGTGLLLFRNRLPSAQRLRDMLPARPTMPSWGKKATAASTTPSSSGSAPAPTPLATDEHRDEADLRGRQEQSAHDGEGSPRERSRSRSGSPRPGGKGSNDE